MPYRSRVLTPDPRKYFVPGIGNCRKRGKWYRVSASGSEMMRTSSRCENYLHDVNDGANTTCNQSSTNRILLKIRTEWESAHGKLKNEIEEKMVRHVEKTQRRKIIGK